MKITITRLVLEKLCVLPFLGLHTFKLNIIMKFTYLTLIWVVNINLTANSWQL